MRCIPTFLGAHEIPDEFLGRTDAYVELVIEEMLPLVVWEKPPFSHYFVELLDYRRLVLSTAYRFLNPK